MAGSGQPGWWGVKGEEGCPVRKAEKSLYLFSVALLVIHLFKTGFFSDTSELTYKTKMDSLT